jgi:hypothetical protein
LPECEPRLTREPEAKTPPVGGRAVFCLTKYMENLTFRMFY